MFFMLLCTYLVFLDESDKHGPLNLNRLTCSIIKSDDKVEKIGFTEVRRRLFLKVSSSDPNAIEEKINQKKRWVKWVNYVWMYMILSLSMKESQFSIKATTKKWSSYYFTFHTHNTLHVSWKKISYFILKV